MSWASDYYLGIAEDVEHLLCDLGHDVDLDEFDVINWTVTWGDTHELSGIARLIVRALEDAEPETREALLVRACEVVMELDDLAGERVEPIAA